jgi:sec-independent protein translocase protein TatC
VALSVLDVVMLQLFLAIIFAVVTVSPLVFFYLYRWGKERLSFLGRFINKRALIWWGTIGGIVFAIGLFYSYNYLVPPMFKFLMQIAIDADISNMWRIGDFVWLAIMVILLLSLALEAPLIIFALVRSGILPLHLVIKGRRYFYLAIIIFSALFTSPDAFTQLVTAVPVIVFVEITVIILKIVGPKEAPPPEGEAVPGG